MTALAVIFARGATIVCLVSLNTRLIADGRYSAAVGVSGLLSACWWINARIANRADGLPPLLIQTGSDEILANDSDRLAEALDGADCDARYQRYPGRWHVFQLHAGMLHDADLALAECRDFLHQHWR